MAARSLNCDDFSTNFQHVINYLEKQKEVMDAHMVDFFTSSHWESLLPRQIREDLELLSPQQLASLPTACNHEPGEIDLGENLKQFLAEASKAQLKSFPWLRERREFSNDRKVNFISHIMTPKKSHEVEAMSDVVNSLATQFQVSKILDLGSGKGYLSQYLALQYGLKVIGVDSSDSNTQNAFKRNERLLKAWQGLAKKSKNDKVEHISDNIPGGTKTSTQGILDSSSKQTCCRYTSCSYNGGSECDSIKSHSLRQNSVDSDSKDYLYTSQGKVFGETGKLLSSHSKQLLNHGKPLLKDDFTALSCQSSDQNSLDEFSSSPSQQCDKVVQNKRTYGRCVPEDTCCCKTLQTGHEANASISNSQTATTNSFLPVTGFVDQSFLANGELRKLFDQLSLSDEDCFSETNGMFLVGLHSCGDLVPVALRIFVSQPSVKLICIVGCCYHLVSQEFGSDGTHTSNEPGFPMSQFLKPFRLHVSRNATMVAQQAAEKIASESKFPPPSVLYRAILQVILKEKFGLYGRGLHVGKAGSKCKGFKDYVHKCLIKLGLEDRISELSDEELESYHDRFKSKEKQLHAFHQLRATIAPCIESVFLLDRLCYLYEQGFKSASIVRLFDPVKSPRCYAIIASKT